MYGADPELIVLDTSGMKVTNLGAYRIPKDGPIGYDHSGRVLELRPAPVITPLELTNSVQKLIVEVGGMLPTGFSIIACTWCKDWPDSLGSHLHYSFKTGKPKPWWDGLRNLCGALLGLPCLLLNADYSDVYQRYRNQARRYGAIDDMRYCWFGKAINHRRGESGKNPNGFEYRSVGGIVLSSPQLYLAVATIFDAIITAYSKGYVFPKKLYSEKSLYETRNIALSMIERYDVWGWLEEIAPREHVSLLRDLVAKGGIKYSNKSILDVWKKGL